MTVRVSTDSFDPGTEVNAFLRAADGAGAAVTFTGVVRSKPDDPITALTLECYPELAVNQLTAIVEHATARFGLLAATVIHRYGTLHPGEPIVQVMTLSPHRDAAFKSAEFLMDYLKTDAPFWKQETGPKGTHWVEAKAEDDLAKARWE
ncbi:MAG: molybdenum cofactor biosynthesis protein MoaE [Devosia sp.]|nr:molybdenum cofactor biosynthesis protein MoaE [Devosia sp.]